MKYSRRYPSGSSVAVMSSGPVPAPGAWPRVAAVSTGPSTPNGLFCSGAGLKLGAGPVGSPTVAAYSRTTARWSGSSSSVSCRPAAV